MIQRLVRVEKVWHVKGHVLGMRFNDGCEFDLDLKPMISGREDALHGPLHDLNYFKQVAINGLTIEWPNGLDVCPDGLRRWCEAGRVGVDEAQKLEVPLER